MKPPPTKPPPGFADFPNFYSVKRGVWEAVAQLSGDELAFEHLFVILGMFGFGVYL